jgi:hypothetical protein
MITGRIFFAISEPENYRETKLNLPLGGSNLAFSGYRHLPHPRENVQRSHGSRLAPAGRLAYSTDLPASSCNKIWVLL